jgi:hypothetical protein
MNNEFEVRNTITLNDDTKYMIMSKVNHEEVTYLFLMNIDNEKDYKFCNLDKENKIFELKDGTKIKVIAPLLYKRLVEEIDKF